MVNLYGLEGLGLKVLARNLSRLSWVYRSMGLFRVQC